MKDMLLSWSIFPCETSLQGSSPCEAVICTKVLQAEKKHAKSMAIWWRFAGGKRKRTAPCMWGKHKFQWVLFT